jgi:transcription-repair coupling factor (superfamily II helicase)
MQHGHIASVGFHLYTRLLSEAVNQAKSGSDKPSISSPDLPYRSIRPLVSVELPISVGIPQTYLPDEKLRLQLYRRIADIINIEEIDRIKEEFVDRFGPLPGETKNLFWQLETKLKAEMSGLAAIAIEGKQIVLRYPPLPEGIKARSLIDLGASVRRGRNAYWMPINGSIPWRIRLGQLLTVLADHQAELDKGK